MWLPEASQHIALFPQDLYNALPLLLHTHHHSQLLQPNLCNINDSSDYQDKI